MSNRLKDETSPYLQQHADNPVDWYPWGDEALTRARKEDRPILLSIGYSACHWCHVMERESFEDEDTAALMNQGFVNIKVDREERPDLDSIYMRAVQASTGRGGWPLTAFLLPDGRFFYGGTYFPPEARYGMPSFRQVLAAVLDAYRNRRGEVEEGAGKLLQALRQPSSPRSEPQPADPDPAFIDPAGGEAGPEEGGLKTAGPESSDPASRFHRRAPELLRRAAKVLEDRFDPIRGGFGPAPKFPQPTTLEFLLHHFHGEGSPDALAMVLTTLRAMARGGIRDHLGGGFHRYSVDDRWLVPHFEKMLYDNGLLARVFLHAHLVTGDPELKGACTSTLDYLLEDLRHPEGGFFSARDADSEGAEGVFYLWRPAEIREVLGKDRGDRFCRVYGVTESGNFEGANILHLGEHPQAAGLKEERDLTQLQEDMREARTALLEQRRKRDHPFRDEKILVSWNGFVLRALAEAGVSLGREDYLQAAEENARFILGSLVRDGNLHRSWKDGEVRVPAFLEDHAALGNGLLTLYEATLNGDWLREARRLADRILDQFWSPEDQVLFDSSREAEELVMRPRDPMDNATPSGNSMAVELFLRLYIVLGEEEYRTRGHQILDGELDMAIQLPSAFGRLLSAAHRTLEAPLEIVILGKARDPEVQDLLGAAHQAFLPNRVVAGGPPDPKTSLPILEGREMREGRPTAYICRDFTCSQPLHDPQELRRELEPSVRQPSDPGGRNGPGGAG